MRSEQTVSHVRRGDTVGVIAGRERGKRGKVLRVLMDKGRVLVEHVNMVKKHQRPTQKLRQGGIIEREGPLALSNVLLVCARCDKPARTGIKLLADGRKVRTCKRCGEAIDKG
jgi:large subunit ribosomal protein L24